MTIDQLKESYPFLSKLDKEDIKEMTQLLMMGLVSMAFEKAEKNKLFNFIMAMASSIKES